MSQEHDDDPPAGAAKGATGPDPRDPPNPIGDLRNKVTEAASEFLKAKLGFEEGVDGGLQFPDRGVFENFGQRADQFVRGFFRGFADKPPEARDVTAGMHDPRDVPSGAEVATRLLAKVSDTMSTAFHDYLQDHAVDPDKPGEPVVVDGRFVLRHGAPLLATLVQALGTKLNEPRGAEPFEAHDDDAKPAVDYRLDLPSVFKSLFVRPPSEPGPDPDGGKP